MNTQIMLTGIFVFISVVLLIASYFVNEFNSEGVIFGVRVPTKYREDEKIKEVIRNYRKNNTIFVVLVVAGFLLLFTNFKNIGVFTLGVLLVSFSNALSYGLANKEMKKVKEILNWSKEQNKNKVYVEIGGKKESDSKGYIVLFAISTLISVIVLAIALAKVDSLPNLVPVHFSNGGADRYVDITTAAGKFEYYMISSLGVILNVTMFISTIFYKKKMNSGRLNGGSLSLIKGRRNLSKNIMGNLMGVISIMVTIMISFGVLLTTEIVPFNEEVENLMMIPTMLIIGGPLLYIVYAQRKENRKLLSEDKGGEEYYIDDDENYLFGIFYYNKKDDSNIVIRRIGMGYDFNYAKTLGKVFAIAIGLLLIGTLLVTFFVKVPM